MNEDTTDTGVRISITNKQGEVYLAQARVLVSQRQRLYVEDTEGELMLLDELMSDAWGWADPEK